MRLLVIDTDRNMVQMITSWLKSLGHEVYGAYNEEQARIKWLEHQPDLVITDSYLGEVDALMMSRDLQSKYDALVLVLTEAKDTRDEVRCLQAGADSYLRKPFLPDQLLAHIQSLSRRMRMSSKQVSSPVVHVGSLFVDLLHNEVRVHKKNIRLTPTESKIMHILALHAGSVCTLEQIVKYVWEFVDTEMSSLVKPHIYNLRHKIETNPQDPRYILTVPNVGYMMARVPEDEIPLQIESVSSRVKSISSS
jgi:DNA-binding response OmpR family regulator